MVISQAKYRNRNTSSVTMFFDSYRSSVRLRSQSTLSSDFVPDAVSGSLKILSGVEITEENVLRIPFSAVLIQLMTHRLDLL